MTTTPRPLEGIRVLAIENFVAGPYGSMVLADFGAEVIKVEPPGTGEGYRSVAPYWEKDGAKSSMGLMRCNRNKKSVALNLQTDAGKDLFRKLAKQSDVVWENLRPDVMNRLGIGYEALSRENERLIYVSLSGYGHADVLKSPFLDRPAFDIIGQAMSGLMYRPGNAGDPPVYLGFPLGDQYTSMIGVIGALVALQWRHLTGKGQHVDVAMYDTMASLNEYAVNYYAMLQQVPTRGAMATSAPYGAFKVKDGYVVIAVVGPPIWDRFCRGIGRTDLLEDPTLQTGADRGKRQDDYLRPLIEEWAADKTRAEVTDILTKAGVPASPIQDVDDLFGCPHVAARQMLMTLDDPAAGPVKVAGNPIKLSGVPESPNRPAPQLGADGDEILGGLLGLDEAGIARLRSEGVVG
ncbi:MAG: CoA transferase [Chloroflexi bacterium]|nr:CoA transferase [Chloroflexota bacterium]